MTNSRTRRVQRRIPERQQRNQAALKSAPAGRNNQFDQARTCVVCRGPAGMTAECVRCGIDDDVRMERIEDQ